ncbi:carboxyl transferase domain-containing protein [Amycolatopsis thermophila]|uniref:acetyl-CoA carboxylase n=1 Tax=Amycolatopsis thermophila TaxID=206084 RepID=A0ABU0F003_9PSEU|nr:carboxyl transferase domain-containing protein [Amycolatopsis thermophila]MDQ0380899.1 acetyl/propionyl-CoA carboxylase alpha subunit/acetyl-CoA carboxylase carboxyltransferase component [Amycolatopsis thermophila]
MPSLLVANRGEIAVRIIATAAGLGFRTVAVYPEDDADCAHVTRADHAERIPGTGPAAYLDAASIVGTARRAGCDFLHPGYGFLSESPLLARLCAAAGIRFAGPSAEALTLFGDKTSARARARELGIPVLAGTEGPADPATAEAFLAEHGAVMVKAVAGGGGRGVLPVTDPTELPAALRRCSSEALAAFGNGSVYLEQLLPRARHIEVQVAGDGGTTVALGDRDCSLQRRRQKLIEIAPAALPAGVRARLHEAAVRLVGSTVYRGLATAEFLVTGEEFVFLEVNPRLQVEHTVTEEVTGLDLVELGLRLAAGESLDPGTPQPRGIAIQARVNTETVRPDGTVLAGSGPLTVFQPPTGHGIRVDTHGYPGYAGNPRYDSLLAKVIVTGADPGRAAARARRALGEFAIAGPPTNIALLRALLAEPVGTVDTTFVDRRLPDLAEDIAGPAATPGTVAAPQHGVVVQVCVAEGETVPAGAELVVLEAMKMEHVITADRGGVVLGVAVKAGDTVTAGAPLVSLRENGDTAGAGEVSEADLDRVRPDLAETLARHEIGLDSARPDAVARRHESGHRTARENVEDLCDPGSFTEYGALAIAAQRRRRDVDDLIRRTPADGMVTGTATIGGQPAVVLAYDYTVLAGTQGVHNHRKTDRMLRLARDRRLPVVLFAEGGGGRPGDTDTSAVAQLDVPTFRMAALLAGEVPTIAIVSGYCFAGNAALAGVCDVVIATEDSSLGMGGPAMIEGGGLGVVAPGDVGPMPVQYANGVVDVLAADEAEAVAVARRYLSYFAGPREAGEPHDQRRLRHLVPENRVRVYDVRPVLSTVADRDSLLELRAGFGTGVITALARIGGIPVGVLANNPGHLGGAIDGDAADKAARFLNLCRAHRLPVVSFVDTPGFMVGPEAEKTATVRRFGDLFVAGARVTSPLVAVVLRKAYGLGAMAMTGGSLHAPALTVAWPTGEFGGMGLEGAVRLGFRKELESIADPEARHARYTELVAEYYERGKALSTATVFEIDDVIDPAGTRAAIIRTLAATAGAGGEPLGRHRAGGE